MSVSRSLMAASMALLGPLAQAAPVASSDVTIRDVNGLSSSVSAGPGEAAVLAPLSLGSALSGGLQQSLHQGVAAAAQQTLRGVATLSAWHPSSANLFTASTDASFSKQVQVLPGTSGLEWGAPVQFDVLLRVDGQIGAGWLNPLAFGSMPTYGNARSLASVDARVDYRIIDLDQDVPGCGECGPAEVMGFGYYGHVLFDAKVDEWTGAEGLIESRWGPQGEWVGGTLPSANNYEFVNDDIRASDQLSHFPDTSLRRYTVSTFVGNTLEITGDMNLFVQAMGQGTTSQSTGYFAHSFDAELVSGQGLAFSGEIAGIYPAVPEPGRGATLLAGLALLGSAARRRAVNRREPNRHTSADRPL